MSDANSEDRDGRVSRRAYELWEQEGGEHGRHEDHWHRAASEVDDQASIPAADGTMLTVPIEEVEGDAAEPARKRAAPKKTAAAPVASAKAKAPAKPRKPK